MTRPTAYTRPYPIRSHATLAEVRTDLAEADTAAAREMVASFRADEAPSRVLDLALAAMSGAVAGIALCLFFMPLLGGGQ